MGDTNMQVCVATDRRNNAVDIPMRTHVPHIFVIAGDLQGTRS
jgi:hypothetical protein